MKFRKRIYTYGASARIAAESLEHNIRFHTGKHVSIRPFLGDPTKYYAVCRGSSRTISVKLTYDREKSIPLRYKISILLADVHGRNLCGIPLCF